MSAKTILFARYLHLAKDYLRHYSLDPSHFKIVTDQDALVQAIRGTTKNRVVILNDESVGMMAQDAIRATKARVDRVSY